MLHYISEQGDLLMAEADGGSCRSLDDKGEQLSVSVYLTVYSILTHVFFILISKHRTKYTPTQYYRNWQDTIKNFFLAVVVAQVHGIEYFFQFLNVNRRLGQLF